MKRVFRRSLIRHFGRLFGRHFGRQLDRQRARAGRHFFLSLVLVLVADARVSFAQCQRPTDAAGFGGYAYGADTASHFDGVKVRVYYAVTGSHAVNTSTTRVDGVPDNVVTAATVGDAALDAYAQLGFLPPVTDGTCGGDARLDVYLMHFNAADGDTASGACTPSATGALPCASFGLVEARLESLYGTFELGAHVVIAHELFHAVQNSYDSGLDRFWAEGTAQWAAKTIYPAETDLEDNLPAFFADAGRSIDVPPGGVTAGYFYGAAIWPVFLAQHVGPDLVRASLAKEAQLGPPSMDAIAAALTDAGRTLGDEYGTFAAWNAATGSRAGTGGYTDGATYPKVKTLTALTAAGISDIGSGYSIFFYSFDLGAAPQLLSLDADATRLVGETFPLVSGKARLDQLATLPATVSGPGVLVVAGISAKKTDAPFTVRVTAPATTAPPDLGALVAESDLSVMPSPVARGACAVGGAGAGTTVPGGARTAFGLWMILALLALQRRRTVDPAATIGERKRPLAQLDRGQPQAPDR